MKSKSESKSEYLVRKDFKAFLITESRDFSGEVYFAVNNFKLKKVKAVSVLN
jgi:hypothetical protein